MKIRLGLGVAVAVTATMALGHSGATGVVKERMDAMSSIAANMKSVSQMLRGSVDFDSASVAAAMQEISQHAAMLPHQFPEGTDAAPSEAAPSIWTDTEGFNAIFHDLEMSAAEIASLADDKAAVQQGFGKVAATCKACHADYRIDRD